MTNNNNADGRTVALSQSHRKSYSLAARSLSCILMVIVEEEGQKQKAIKIADIKIGSRLRKKLTDIDSLAVSIAKVGLLHPPVIDENYNNKLIAGFRRIKACEKLGWTEIPVTRINIKNAIQGEYDENVERAGFALEDVAAIHEEVQKTRIGHRPTAAR